MNTLFFDASIPDDPRRTQLFDGHLFVYSPTPSSQALVEFARQLIAEALGDLDPETAQYHLPVEQYASILADLNWNQPVRNSSRTYNYAEWNRTSRFIASKQIGKDTRIQPRPEEPMELDPQIRAVTPAGGILVFSAAQMHSTVPNTTGKTRFSIDFRTVNIDDARAFRGAPNIDSECTGTTMNDYLKGSDLAHIPADVLAMHDPGLGAKVAS